MSTLYQGILALIVEPRKKEHILGRNASKINCFHVLLRGLGPQASFSGFVDFWMAKKILKKPGGPVCSVLLPFGPQLIPSTLD